MSITNDLSRLANNANVIISAISVNSTAITSVNVAGITINSSGYTGDANNAAYLGGQAAAVYVNTAILSGNVSTLQGQITANAAAAYTNSVSYTDTAIGTANTAMAANASAAYSNSVTYTDTKINTANTAMVANASAAYTNATVFASNASNVNTGTLAEARLPYRMNQNLRTSDNVEFTQMTLTGNLVVSGNVNIIGANNLSISDNMVYLNSNNDVSSPDIGIAGNYNDGVYAHTGIFRDASDGIWKVFDNYTPEPDASVYIDTSNNTFHLANFQANTFYGGNTSANWFVANTLGITHSSNTATFGSAVYIVANGNVGVGTSSPSYKLDVNGVINTTDQIRAYGGGGDVRLNGNYAGTTAVVGTVGSTGFGVMTSNEPSRLWITSGGNVGINTTSPYGKFTVRPSTNDTSITLNDGDPATGAWIRNDGSNMVISTNIGNMYYGYNGSSKTLYFLPGGVTSALTIGSDRVVYAPTQFRAPIIYDYDDTSFRVDPNDVSVVNYLRATNHLRTGSNDSYININYDQIWRPDAGTIHLQYNTAGNVYLCAGGGYTYTGTSLRSPIFYDQNDTSYYIDGNSTSYLQRLYIISADTTYPALSISDTGLDNGGPYGMVNLTRPADTTKAHLAFIRSGNYVWQLGYASGTNNLGFYPWNFSGTQGTPTLWLSGSSVYTNVDIRTPILYDRDNTGYYCDPNSTSLFNTVEISAGTSRPLRLTTSSAGPWALSLYRSDLANDCLVYNGGGYWYFNNYIQSENSVRGTIFYDSNDTGYYTDPNGTSNLYRLNVNGSSIAGSGYTRLVNGMIIQWGNQSVCANCRNTYNFPLAFPSGCYGFAATGDWNDSNGWQVCGGTPISASQFVLTNVVEGARQVYWMAIGY